MANWIEAHPVLFATVLWPLVSALVTWALKPRSPEQYQAMHPRVAAALKLVGALGLDVPNTLQAVRQLIRGRAVPAGLYRAAREPEPIPVVLWSRDEDEVPPTVKPGGKS